ncbi:CU044_2847 family protein [Streptomyces sp. NBC_00893]|uniref:CU044_2847 family protein n=1 Tax=Streptomyces sp. NBC_00893 TaxID=2975862 RepID=UPI002251B3D3|nr:CU044_2847 family protein [Streptomyces sp. NBC_00893]MCX4844376.1 CU044_2847 family protein [Streptomyces sp. NBC_00893]
MTALMEFTTESGATVTVEVDRHTQGAQLVALGDDNTLARAGRTFDSALTGIRSAAESALAVFRDGALKPDGVELEFGVKITAEAGAVIARSAVEGHLTVKLSWSPGATPAVPATPPVPTAPTAPTAPAAPSGPAVPAPTPGL